MMFSIGSRITKNPKRKKHQRGLPYNFASMRYIFICLILSVFCLSLGPAFAQENEAITTPILTTVPNFRDLSGISASIPGVGPTGGTGFVNPTTNYGVMRTGIFYRTDALSQNGYPAPPYQGYPPISDANWATVSSLGIGEDIDLRTTSEITSNPERTPAGAAYINISIYGTTAPSPTASDWSDASQMTTFMVGMYRNFVNVPTETAALGQVLLNLAHASNPVLFHCDSGKDRTGWTATVLESIAGVSPATMMNDYLASNTYMNALLTSYAPILLSKLQLTNPAATLAAVNANLFVANAYLTAALNQVITSYGSMNAYLMQGLGLSQADIYVLRAKMVYYPTLPGQNGFAGNAAAGARLLNDLQNSPLSGNYTAFNYYLQSAIDAGTLGSVPNRVGGQVYPDTACFLLRLPRWIDEAVMPYAKGADLSKGQTRFWMSDLGGRFSTEDSSFTDSSTEYNTGTLLGISHRFDANASADLGVGYNWGWVGSAGASATVNTILTTMGGRYGFSGLETGPFMTVRADSGYTFYDSKRPLDGGLGDANGNTYGAFYSGLAGFGDIIRAAPFTFTLQPGVRVTGETLHSFNESGSELALHFNSLNKVYPSLLCDLGISLDRGHFGAWSLAPALNLGYERELTNPRVKSIGTIYDYSVSQYSAFDSRDLSKAGLTVTAERGKFMITGEINGLMGGAAKSAGFNGQLSVTYKF